MEESEFGQKAYIDTWIGLNANLIQLWTMFAAGNFAACALAVTSNDFGSAEKWAMTIGFWLFALGNFTLIFQKLSLLRQIKLHAYRKFEAGPAISFAKMTNPAWCSAGAHFLIDLCVTAITWRDEIYWIPNLV